MSRRPLALAALTLPALAAGALVACADTAAPTAPLAASAAGASFSSGSGSSGSGARTQTLELRDDCDSTSFNAAIGAGGCVRRGSVTFDKFIAELRKKRFVGSWKNNPDQFGATVGTVIDVRNVGGEAHSFTRVAAFGGGVVPLLNDLSGSTTVAPECPAMIGATTVPAGGRLQVPTAGLAPGTHKFQCCIHPWMRTTATLKKS